MTYANQDTTNLRAWLRVGLALLALPAMLVFASCDSGGNGSNEEPEADFTYERDGLTVDFDASDSEDSDGNIASYSWEFGDGETGEGETASRTYQEGGDYDVTLTVEDDEGASDSETQTVSPEMGTTGGSSVSYANYDSTETAIVFNEQNDNELGVVPEDASNNENVRENYVKWTSDNTYHIDGRTFVNPGDTLEIEAGTVVKGIPNQDPSNASVLVVASGGTILADGNPGSSDPSEADPIIFTTREDDVSDPNDLSPNLDGAWGGVIILGNGPKNFPGSRNVEGIPSDVDRASFGSNNSDLNDDSGVFRFAHIRYGGISIGAGNEINGLTMGAVGSGTTIEWVEVFNNQDDGFEWFGGNVNGRYLVSSRNGDDSFDIDQGYSGNLQFLLAVQTPTRGDRTGEHDGGDSGYGAGDEGDEPFSDPQIYNATYVGSGPDGAGDVSLKLRDNFAGNYFNSIFYDFPVQFVEVEEASGPDSRARWEEGDLTVENSLMYQFGSVESLNDPTTEEIYEALVENDGDWGAEVADSLEAYGNTYEDPGLSRDLSGDIQTVGVIPQNDVSGGQTPDGSFFEDVSYRGAFDPSGGNWAAGWTFSDEVGMFQ